MIPFLCRCYLFSVASVVGSTCCCVGVAFLYYVGVIFLVSVLAFFVVSALPFFVVYLFVVRV